MKMSKQINYKKDQSTNIIMKNIVSKSIPFLLITIGFLTSCASKKDVILFQDIQESQQNKVNFAFPKIQINDILDIKISALNPETAIPYNASVANINALQSLELIKLNGYLVSEKGTVILPVLGDIVVAGKTKDDLEKELAHILESKGHLKNPTVNVRILNAKVTVLGEVKMPGTYTYTEQYISLPQALGYAGDVTAEANRKEVVIIREEDGVRKYHKIDLTKSDWFNSPYFTIKQNDIVYVYPNNVKVKSTGFIGNTATVLSVISILLTSFVLLTR
jgi:polysaccharide export outer membrane protein